MSSDMQDDGDLPPELSEAFGALAYYMQARGIGLIALKQTDDGEVDFMIQYIDDAGVTLQ